MKIQTKCLMALIAIISSVTFSTVHANSLEAYYAFDKISGKTVTDSSGNKHTGSLNGAKLTTGKFGQALQFDGVDDFVDIGKFDVLEGGLTLSAWIKADDFGIHDARIISKSTGIAEQDHYWMLSTINKNGIKLRFRLKTNGKTTTLFGTRNVPKGEWVHVAATYDGGNMRLYLNGKADGSIGKAGVISANASVGIRVGDNPKSGKRNFKGAIDEVRVHSKALSASELGTLMKTDPTPKPPAKPEPTPTPKPTLPPNSKNLIVVDGFEGGVNLKTWRKVPAFYKTSNISREGKQSVHFLPDKSGGKRSELVLTKGKGNFVWGQEYWVGFSVNVRVAPKGFRIISQHHSTPGVGADGKTDWSFAAGGNSFTLKAEDGNFVIYTSTNPKFTNLVITKGGATRGTVSVSRPYTLNKWHDIVMHFRYASDNTGIMEIWMDGNKIVNVKNGPTVNKFDVAGRPKTPKQYQKIGFYHGTKEPIGEVLYDAFRIGGANASYQDVAPR